MRKAREDAKQLLYPEVIFFSGEKMEIADLNKDELTAQKTEVKNCGYQMVEKGLFKLVENEKLKSQQIILKKIAFYWETKEESIQCAVEAGFLRDANTIANFEKQLKKLKGLFLSKDTILQDGESVIALKNSIFTQEDFDIDKNELKEKEKKVKNLSDEIELLSKNNKMLKLLSSLSTNKQVVTEYRDTVFEEKGSVRCPICGSESFATMEKELILKEADDYIRQNGEVVKAKENDRSSLQTEIDVLYQKIINCAKTVVEKEQEKLEKEISKLKVLKEEMQPYFDEVQKLQKISKTIDIEGLTSEEVKKMQASVDSALLEKSQEEKEQKNYQQILTVLGYKYENETLQQTYAKVKNLITKSYEVSNFSYDILVSKLNAIDSILANQTLFDQTQKLEADNKKNQKLDIEIKELQKLKTTAIQRAENIREIVEQLSKDEYEKIGPVLGKFYNKLARFNSSDGIKIVQEKDGISLVDNKRKNIVNVLSNGQISVFMLSYLVP